MLNILLILILTVTTTNSLDCMEPDNQKLKESWSLTKRFGKSKSDETNVFPKKPKLRRQKSSSLSSIDENKVVKSEAAPIKEEDKVVKPEPAFIKAVRNQDLDQINFYLRDSYFNPNIQNQWGLTGAHCVALSESAKDIDVIKKEMITKIFFEEPRVDFSIKNKRGQIPRDLIPLDLINDDKVTKRTQFFARYMLSKVTNEQALKIHDSYTFGPINDKTIKDLIKEIIESIKNDNKNQDAELPITAQLPDYATPEFIQKMLQFQLSIICNNQ